MAATPDQAHAVGTLKNSIHHPQSPATASPSRGTVIASSQPIPQNEQIIREYAYHLYEQRHCAHGHDVEDWIEAEFSLTPAQQDRSEHRAGQPAQEHAVFRH